jgi:hypothetical protein
LDKRTALIAIPPCADAISTSPAPFISSLDSVTGYGFRQRGFKFTELIKLEPNLPEFRGWDNIPSLHQERGMHRTLESLAQGGRRAPPGAGPRDVGQIILDPE